MPSSPPPPSSPTRVCLLGMGWFSVQAGGLNRYLEELHKALREQGVAATAVVTGPLPEPVPGVVAAGSAAGPLLPRLWALRRATGGLVRRSDVVDAHFALHALPALLGRPRGVPVVVHFHGPWAEESATAGDSRRTVRAKRGVERLVYRRADRLVVLSEAFRRILVDRYGVPAEKVRLVRPGVDVERFAGVPDRGSARRALGLPDGPLVLCVRRLVPRMGLDVLLEAWRRADTGAATLAIAGDGPSRADLHRQVDAADLGGSVRLLGRVSDDDLVALYAAADVSVVPSTSLEGFGLIVLESLAAGTPVIASDLGGMAEVLPALDPSLVVPPGDVAALAARLERALSAPGGLPEREDCRRLAEEHTWALTARQVRGVYDEAAAARRSPSTASPTAVAGRRGGRRPRVVVVGHSAALSGGELALLTLLPALEAVDVHVVLAEDGPLVGRLEAAGVSVEVLALPERTARLRKGAVRPGTVPVGAMWDTADYVRRLARRLRELQADVVHTNTLKAHLYGGLAARWARTPQVWHARDRIAADYLPRPAVAVVRAAVRLLPAAVVANSSSTLATLGSTGRRPVIVLPSAVPADPAPAGRSRGDGDELVIGCVGRLTPWKGQDVLLRAVAAAFPDGGARVRVVGSALFGEDDYAAELERLVRELGLEGRVDMTGFVDDVPAQLAEMDVLVHCSRTPEPFGQVVVQGMAAGLPVVAADAGGPAEVVEAEVTGLLTPPGDEDALSRALLRLAAEPDLRRRLGEAGRRAAVAYEPHRLAPRLESLYDEVLARR
ncbi:glycosyltransferase family 4 protein [uncultured Pseudokineococcus sp.]|uniref:glycosyltransferase family 4 protein n=1 Tax=uncultured Pseudokineococcus sp. TaxID=1642928 RepID=UPI002624644F|nr:glycosyltransferase family 4 protein [uncultured Pseudokineococcus sp.]